ncbi:MAG: MarR family winged helix-turn-helix transcriptional regulator [Hyphomicrobium sp.]
MSNAHESLLLALHGAVEAANTAFVANLKPGVELTPRHFIVLAAVARRELPSQTDLVACTGIDRSTLADVVRRLVEDGILQRWRSPADARAYAISLTRKGVKLLAEAERVAGMIETRLQTTLAPSLVGDLVAALQQLTAALQPDESAEGGAPPSAWM